MKNIVTATIVFSFKGKTYQPSIILDLDKHMLKSADLGDLYRTIAAANHIDQYSYEYEVMQATPVTFSNAQGLVADFISDGILDIEAFEAAWQENQTLEKIRHIAEQHMGISDLNQHPELKQALLSAYQAGLTDSH